MKLTDVKSTPTAETSAQFLDRLGMDGVKWAREFKLTAEKLGHAGLDEGWLIGWFCNAIMAGYDEGKRRAVKGGAL